MLIKVILAVSSNCVIGADEQLPWKIPEELAFFRDTTMGTIVVMGHSTWKSMNCKVLPNRVNIVVSKTPENVKGAPDYIIPNLSDIKFIYNELYPANPNKEIYVIGGAQIVDSLLEGGFDVARIIISRIPKKVAGDTFFYNTFNFKLRKCSEREKFDILEYSPSAEFRNERKYLKLLKNILKYGDDKMDRTGTGTRSLFGERLSFNLKEGFPLLTTKEMFWKAVQKELFFFLSGKTNTKELEASGVNIWRAHTSREFLERRGLDYEEGEMGPMYGYQWRNFGGTGLDQLTKVIEQLKTDPFSRRILMTTYNPFDVEKGALYPCHGISLQFSCRKDSCGQMWLSAVMNQRSADAFLGLPFNIASYALLVHLIAHHVKMRPEKLVFFLGDAHIYKNHIKQVHEQLTREPLVPPRLQVIRDLPEDFKGLDESYIKLRGYFHYEKIRADIAI